MSDSFSAHADEPARPKRLWTGGTLDLRAAATYPKRQVPGLALFAVVGTVCMLGLWKVAKVNQKRKYVLLMVIKHISSFRSIKPPFLAFISRLQSRYPSTPRFSLHIDIF